MPVILSIETSSSVCSAALHENGNLLDTKEIHTPHSAASQLAIQIDSLFSDTKISKQKLKAVAVSAGPGSYTGLRIGVATAKGICLGLNVPLIAVDTLIVLAEQIDEPHRAGLLCPMLDARRMEVYCCLLDSSHKILEPTQAKIIDESSFAEYLSQHTILFFGNGSDKCRETIRHPNASFLENAYPCASSMGRLAFQKFTAHEFENLEDFEPRYLKEFVAKTKSA